MNDTDRPWTTGERLTLLALIVLVTILVVAAVGCGSLVPEKRTEGASVKATESVANTQSLAVERITRGTPPPSVTVSGASNRVELHYESAAKLTSAAGVDGPTNAPGPFYESVAVKSGVSTDSKSVESAKGNLSVSLPLGVSLILIAIGGGMLFFLWRKLKASSAAFAVASEAADRRLAEAFTAADRELGELLYRETEMAAASTDAASIARSTRRQANLERARGKLAKLAPSPKP